MKCTQCNKEYVRKAEAALNIRLKNHRKDTKNPNAILACRHFQQQGHNFNSHAKLTVIDKLANISALKTFTRTLNTTRKLDPGTKNLSSVQTEPTTQQIEMRALGQPFHVHFYLAHSSQVTLEL